MVAEQDFGNGRPSRFARIPDVEYSRDVVDPGTHRDRASSDEDDDRRPSGRDDLPDQFLLPSGKPQAGPVPKFAFLDSDNDNRGFASGRGSDGFGHHPVAVAGDAGIPNEREPGVSLRLGVFEAKIVGPALYEIEFGRQCAPRPLAPIVDQEAAVKREPITVVAVDPDPEPPRLRRFEASLSSGRNRNQTAALPGRAKKASIETGPGGRSG